MDEPGVQISYRDWGDQFFATAISADRILGAVRSLAGQPIDFGPKGVGPGRLAKIRAYGEIGEATATPVTREDLIAYRVEIPVRLAFEVDLQVEKHRFKADLVVPLELSARALDGVRIRIDVVPPQPADIVVRLRAEGLRATITQRVAGVEGELKRFVARYVTRELDKPDVRRARLIDVAALIDRAWTGLPGAPPPSQVTDDLDDALTEELADFEDAFRDGSHADD